MNKKTSPQARSARRPRSRGRVESGVRSVSRASRRQVSAAEKTSDRVSLKARLKYFVPFTVVPNVIVVSLLLVLAIAGLMFTNTTLVALPATVAQLWLILNAAPVVGEGQLVSAVPLLPALVLIAALSNRVFSAVKDKVSLADLYVVVGLALGVPLLLTLISWGMLIDAASVLPVDAPPLWLALGRTVLVHVLVVVIGMGSRLWRALCRRFGLPEWIVDANYTALKFLATVGGFSLVVSLVMLIAHVSALKELFSHFHGVGAMVGLIALSVMYVPNVVVASSSVLLGGEYHFGDAWVSLFGSHVVPFPTLPWFVLIPTTVYSFTWLILIVPVVLAVWVVRGRLDKAEQPFAEMMVTGLFSGVYAFIGCVLISGSMGVYQDTGPMIVLTTVLVVAWLSGVGLLVAGVHNMRSRRMMLPPEEEYLPDDEWEAYPEETVPEETDLEETVPEEDSPIEPIEEIDTPEEDWEDFAMDTFDQADPEEKPTTRPDVS